MGCYRADLRQYLICNKVKWVDDPMNDDTKYTRVRARRVLKELRALGIDQRVLVETSNRMENAAEVLNEVAIDAGNKYVKLQKWGDIEVNRRLFQLTRDDTYLRLLAHLIKFISGKVYRPRYQELNKFASALSSMSFKARTIGGVIARALDEERIVLRREPSIPIFITSIPAKRFIWDGRWDITLSANKLGDLEKIGPLGKEGITQIKENVPDKLPREGLRSTPTLFSGDKVVASPLLNFGRGLNCRLLYKKSDLINSLSTH